MKAAETQYTLLAAKAVTFTPCFHKEMPRALHSVQGSLDLRVCPEQVKSMPP